MSKRLIFSIRLLFTLFILALLFFLQERPITSSNEPIQLYASICHDDLRKITLDAIGQANASIDLVMYSLTDENVIHALNQKAHEGIDITVFHDPTTQQWGYESLSSITCIPAEIRGLMHQKILVIDQKHVWIGSANFTTESLRLHDNLAAWVTSPELAQMILSQGFTHRFTIGGQLFEFWNLPRDRKEGLNRLIQLIDQAEQSICIAMYTWTHPDLTEAVVRAHQRGVCVEVILDRGQALGAGRKTTKYLCDSGLPIWLSSGRKLLHHKCLWIDEKILVNGSANWTRAAFSKNKDCFFILHDLTPIQQDKLHTMWKRTRALSNKQHFLVFRQRPVCVRDEHFEFINIAA